MNAVWRNFMDMEDNKKFFQILEEYDKLHICLLVILYYHKNINNVIDVDQFNNKNLLTDLPSGIRKFLNLNHLEDKIKLMRDDQLRELLRKKLDYLNENVKSIFSLCKILFSHAYLYAIELELLMEICSELNIINLEDLKNLLYVGENFNKDSLTELLCILILIKNFHEIHIINYDECNINTEKCLEKVRDELFYVKQDILESMMKKVVIVKEPQLNFDFLNTYIEQNTDEKFIIVIGMERFIKFKNNCEINVGLMNCNFNLSTSENVDWSLLLNNINKMYAQTRETNTFLLTVYVINDVMNDAYHKICLHYKDSLYFDVLSEQMRPSLEPDKDKKLLEELLCQIFNDNNAYEKILDHKEELSQNNFIILKTYYYLSQKDYLHAISELEQLPDDIDLYFNFLLAELYNITGETKKAYAMFKEIYVKDMYFPDLINSIVYALRDSENRDELLFWIKKGLAINPNDPVMVNHLANYYTMTEDYMASAEQWKILFDLTEDPFYIILYEINLILFRADKSQLAHICAWVGEKVSAYPQYADEIYSRIGNIIFDKISKEKALPYFEKVAESYDKNYCVSAVKMVEIYYKMYSRKMEKEVTQGEKIDFAQKLIRHVLILTYDAQSVYSWSSYIHKLFSYDEWEPLSIQLLMTCLVKLARSYLKGEAKKTRLNLNNKNVDDLGRCFENYGGSRIANLEVMNKDEYFMFLLALGEIKIAEGEIQAANDIAYTFFRMASLYEECYSKDISMCFGLLIWSGTSMAIGAYVEGILSFVAVADRLLQIGESAVLHVIQFVFDQFLYLYNSTHHIKLDFSDQLLLEEYFDQFGYPKVMLYRILGKNEEIINQESSKFRTMINQMEEVNIVLLAKNENLHNIIFYDSLISSYYESGELDKAVVYLRRLYPSIAMTLAEHMNIAYYFLKRYSDILVHLRDYDSAIEIFKQLLLLIEKLRGVSFSSERSYLGDPADIVIRRFIYICCEKSRLSGERLESDSLLEILMNMVPRSIIEEKNGNDEASCDEMILRKEKEYYQLFEQLNKAKNKSVNNLAYKQTADLFFETKEYLEKNHPNFKPLKSYTLIGWNGENPFVFLESKLKEGEVFYRNILAEDYLVHILVTKSSYHICSEKVNVGELNELLAHLENMINDSVYDLERSKLDSYIELFEKLTKMLFQPLVDQIDLINSLYYMPDYKLLHITPNFIRTNGKWGIECFSKIELVIDYNSIGNNKRESNNWENRFFISDSTKGELQKIRKTIDKFPSFIKLELNESGRIVIRKPINILVIAAHGISEEFGRSYYGAKKLELSRKKQIDLNEFIVLDSVAIENAIIIACSGGTPTNDKIERNNGVWDSMLKKNVNYILYCKWDVSTRHTNELLDVILQEMQPDSKLLSEALNIAQRKMKDLNPILWSGLEVWKN